MSLLGLDIGTTGCKAVAFNMEGKGISKAYKEYPLLHPFVGSAELDPDRIWESVREIIRKVNMEILHDPVKALAVSSQGETCTN